jgi:putative membrane protein insertion efficiency factor
MRLSARTTNALIGAIRIYQRVAPRRLRAVCRFHPSCSAYSILALEKFGLTKGVSVAVKRLARCRYPNGGIDNP